jgi:hypothetical protein
MKEVGRYDPAKETSRLKAERRWRNNVVRTNFLEKRKKSKLKEVSTEPEIAETIVNEGRKAGPINRLESQFKRDIRAMLQGQADRNLMFYAASLAQRKRRLLLEKLRRLEAKQAAQLKPQRDLFGPVGG